SFAAQTGSSVTGEMTRYLEREIWRTLTKDERTVLEASSLFRGLVPLDALHCFSDNWQLAIHGLQTKNLLAPTISGGVVVHDTIRDYIRERLPEVRRRSFHGLAAVYFFDGSEMRDRIEGMHHMLEAGDTKAFGEYLVSHGSALLEQAKGDLAQAASHMNESVDLATEVSEPGALARSLLALGTLEARRGNAERGLEFKIESLRVAERGGNLTETARASIGVGVA